MSFNFRLRCSLVLATLITCIGSAPAAVLEYKAEFGAPTYSFNPNGFSRAFFQVTSPTPTLTGTLNEGDQFRFVYSAPAGSLFSISPKPDSSTDFGFVADFWTSNFVSVGQDSPGTSTSFVGASGPNPAPAEFELNLGNTGEFRVVATFAKDNFSFKSISATFTIPAGYSRTFTNFTPPTVRLFAYSRSSEDTGAFASLIPEPAASVPEPSSLLLVAGALGCCALVSRKRLQS